MQPFYIDKYRVFDNIEYFKHNSEKDYVDTIQNIIKSDPFEGHQFYIFSFVKRVDDTSGVKKMYHQPRLTRPDPLPGTTLMRVDPRDPDQAEIVWTLPEKEAFKLYSEGKMFSDPTVYDSIQQYEKDPSAMAKPDPRDVSEEKGRELYMTYIQKNRRTARRHEEN